MYCVDRKSHWKNCYHRRSYFNV